MSAAEATELKGFRTERETHLLDGIGRARRLLGTRARDGFGRTDRDGLSADRHQVFPPGWAERRAVQFHGGMGFTWECHAHLFMRRAQFGQFTFGDARHHRRHLAELLL